MPSKIKNIIYNYFKDSKYKIIEKKANDAVKKDILHINKVLENFELEYDFHYYYGDANNDIKFFNFVIYRDKRYYCVFVSQIMYMKNYNQSNLLNLFNKIDKFFDDFVQLTGGK